MSILDETVYEQIKTVYNSLTSVEKNIADFFLENDQKMDFSSRHISSLLFVSEASLSRFAKKCGYKGFREFIFNYEKSFLAKKKINITAMTQQVLAAYQVQLDQSLQLVDEAQMHQIARYLTQAKRVFAYGMGSSGTAADEFKLRFMGLGVFVDAVSDSHMIQISSALTDTDDLVIGFSVSGTRPEVVSRLKRAHERGAKVLIFTSNTNAVIEDCCDEILLIAATAGKQTENARISPQFPLLVMTDIFYQYFIHTDFYFQLSKKIENIKIPPVLDE
ncbi:MAG: MurR/RpiR family transcriptional regulator [Lachnospiraceae bacterium]|nr:MurR/RpiR family transcriptional regulator [Lachnospiraceae bacterium]